MQRVKIVITGAYAAGKTSFIRAVSEIEPLDTDYDVTTDEERSLKSRTTVALDFGTITISEAVKLYLFGTPGQTRFDYMWELLCEGCIGYVVLVDSCRPAHFAETLQLMARFEQITDAPFVVVANKQDDPSALPLSYIRRRLKLRPEVPLLGCSTSDRDSVKAALLTLLEEVAAGLTEP